MAIDTTEKKLSLLNFGLPFWRTLPDGDGSFDAGDKQHVLGLYSGIAAASIVGAAGAARLIFLTGEIE